MVFEVILVVAVLPLVALGLSLASSGRLRQRRRDRDAGLEAGVFLQPPRYPLIRKRRTIVTNTSPTRASSPGSVDREGGGQFEPHPWVGMWA
jgi:hypothetical protein